MKSTHHRGLFCCCTLAIGTLAGIGSVARADDPLERGFADPPPSARLRAYWWWLNGNVDKAAITRDLEEMAAKGFGGALICDAGGAEQDGNDRVPHGPTFMTPEWRELYKHALREADRLGLEMSLNIQSGWNLGGPVVPAEDAPKRLVWSEIRITGPARLEQKLPEPKHPADYYADLFVFAYPCTPAANADDAFRGIHASSEQPAHAVNNATDGNAKSFWASSGGKPGDGPSRARPEWLQFDFARPIAANALKVHGRPGYGPRECEAQASDDGTNWRTLAPATLAENGEAVLAFDTTEARYFRLVMFSAFDPRYAEQPRNVQIVELQLLEPKGAWPTAVAARPTLTDWEKKALHQRMGFSAPDTTHLIAEGPDVEGEESLHTQDVVDLTAKMDADGTLRWDVPAGDWEVIRLGCTLNHHCHVSTCSDGWQGYALDPFDAGAFRRYWAKVVDPLIADTGALAGTALKYLHTDSWEVEVANWTPTMREEFQKRRGYDPLPFLPALAGRIVNSRSITNRFLHDWRKTMGDLAIDNHYAIFRELAHKHGLRLHPESGGPHTVPIDSLRCLGMNDAPMSEFWARSWRHRVGDVNRFFVKQPASAAHTYGHRLVLAEGFTTIGPHWQETLWDNLKPSFDRAICEGLNLLVWHAFTCSPASMGLPGQEYFAGTHFNPNATWWSKSAPFLAYLNRCQFLMQQGLFVADAVYYYGDHVPNFAQLRRSDPAHVLPGYDYDVATEEVVLTRMRVEDGHIVLPDGMRYRVLVLRAHPAISLPVLRQVKALVTAGATVIGRKPEAAMSLQDYPACDEEVTRLAAELWGNCDGESITEHPVGKGRIIWGKTAREVLLADGIEPDFEFTLTGDSTTIEAKPDEPVLEYIHRRDGQTDIYFISNRAERMVTADVRFRIDNRPPQLWDALTGQVRALPVFSQADGRTSVPLEFIPYGSCFVLFRKDAPAAPATPNDRNFATFMYVSEVTGPWTVRFDPIWGGPASVEFDSLVSWTTRPEDGIRFYSGTATYEKTFDLPASFAASPGSRLWLDLGNVRQLADVRLNGKELGILWTMPFRVDITNAVRPTGNRLEVEVVNFWPNRVIGDASLPPEQRRTNTNIRKLTAETPLVESGLLGPVMLQVAK
ncbi:MAG: discoidin domain-containing protein [Phycisphaerae bacterium]|nr:discoidin domain-containing protein [Phycisphaerae bacterium]